jgi:hypothetical protein
MDSLFIDDREVNVRAGQSMGIHAIQYESMEQLRTELRKGGFAILPQDTTAGTRIKSDRL